MKEELDSHEYWELVIRTINKKVIRSFFEFVFGPKVIPKKKPLITVTFSPVRYETVRIMVSLASGNNLQITQFDVETVFLYGYLSEELYINPRPCTQTRSCFYTF